MTSGDFEIVLISFDEKGRPAIAFRVNEAAGKRMREISSKNQGKSIAIVISGIPEFAILITVPFDRDFRLTATYTIDEIDGTYAAIIGHI